MGIPIGGLLAIATGALRGARQNQEAAEVRRREQEERARQARRDELEELQTAARLGNTPGVRFGAPPAPAVAPVVAAGTAALGAPAPGGPAPIPGASANDVEDELHPGLMAPGSDTGGARGPAGGRTAAGLNAPTGMQPRPSAASRVPPHVAPVLAAVLGGASARAVAPTAGVPTAGASAGAGPLGHIAGQDVYFDASQTAAGREEAARGRRRAAYDTLHAERPGEYGAFVEGEDYEQRAAEEAQHARALAAFKGAKGADGRRRFDDDEAEFWAHANAHLGMTAPALARVLAPARIDPNSAEGVAARVQVAEGRADATGRARQRYGTGRSGAASGTSGRVLSAASQALASQRTDKRLDAIAQRAVDAAGGDVQKAATLLVNQPETQDVFTQGLNSTHLEAAAQRYQQRTERASGGGRKKEGVADLVARLSQERTQKRAAYDRAAAALRAQGKTDRDIAGTLGARP